MKVLGIMSGTSLDGVDYALCAVTRKSVRLVDHWHVRFPRRLGARLRSAAEGDASSHDLGQLHYDLGAFYSLGAERLLNDTHPGAVEAVGLHGQTVFHQARRRPYATVQIGEPSFLARDLRVPVVFNFRAAHLAVGGQGAPLAPIFHRQVFALKGRCVCVQNLGGISNVTMVDAVDAPEPAVCGFDLGPCNMVLDAATHLLTDGKRSFDLGGRMARRGAVSGEFLAAMLRHPFFKKRPPKSTGREAFGERYVEEWLTLMKREGMSVWDQLATLTQFAAEVVVRGYVSFLPRPPDRVVLAGGGSKNPELVRYLESGIGREFPGCEVMTSEALGWPVSVVEPAAFAMLAAWRLWNRPGWVPEVHGGNEPVLAGQVCDLYG